MMILRTSLPVISPQVFAWFVFGAPVIPPTPRCLRGSLRMNHAGSTYLSPSETVVVGGDQVIKASKPVGPLTWKKFLN